MTVSGHGDSSIKLAGSRVDVTAGETSITMDAGTVTIAARTIKLDATQEVGLGQGANAPLLNAQTFIAQYGLHAHPSAAGPTGPATPPMTVMRAVPARIADVDAETRPAAAGAEPPTITFAVRSRRGRACFSGSYEDRRLVTPDIRADRANRRRFTAQANPLTLTVFVRPPDGLFDGAEAVDTDAQVVEDVQAIPEGLSPAETEAARAARPIVADPAVLHRPAAPILIDTSADGGLPDGAHLLRIEGLKLDGTLEIAVADGERVELDGCAVRALVIREAAAGSEIVVRGSIFESIVREAEGGGRLVLEYVTVTGSFEGRRLFATDTIFAGAFDVPAPPEGDMDGCVRFSRVPAGALSDPARAFHAYATTEGPVRFVPQPCRPANGGFEARPARFGEPGYGVLSDGTEPALATGAEDGGEVGVYHDAAHVAALAAARTKAGDLMAPEQRIFARYDTRLSIGGG